MKPLARKSKHRSLRQKLYAKAEKVFHAWIRERDRMKGCITCGKQVQEAGHWKHGKLDFSEFNINGQCTACNRFRSGKLDVYTMRLIQMYGLKKVKEMERKAEELQHYSIDFLKDIIERYSIYE